MFKRKNFLRTSALAGVLALSLTACGDGGDTNGGDEGDNGDGGGGTITLGYLPGWPDGLSAAYLWEHVLTENGYEVEMTDVADAGVLYTGVAQGDMDVYPSAWPEVTHAAYMDQYGDDLEDLGSYYEDAVLNLAVPEYTDIDSIPELAENPDMFDGEIVGIEAGAGHMENMNAEVIPTYGLDEAGFTLQESSSAAMLAELESAIDSEEDIVVTLWRPYWPMEEYPVKALEDPEGAMGEPETLNSIATAGFSEEFPEVAEWMGNFELSQEEQGVLEGMVVNEYGEGEYEEAIDAFFEENPEIMDQIMGN